MFIHIIRVTRALIFLSILFQIECCTFKPFVEIDIAFVEFIIVENNQIMLKSCSKNCSLVECCLLKKYIYSKVVILQEIILCILLIKK